MCTRGAFVSRVHTGGFCLACTHAEAHILQKFGVVFDQYFVLSRWRVSDHESVHSLTISLCLLSEESVLSLINISCILSSTVCAFTHQHFVHSLMNGLCFHSSRACAVCWQVRVFVSDHEPWHARSHPRTSLHRFTLQRIQQNVSHPFALTNFWICSS